MIQSIATLANYGSGRKLATDNEEEESKALNPPNTTTTTTTTTPTTTSDNKTDCVEDSSASQDPSPLERSSLESAPLLESSSQENFYSTYTCSTQLQSKSDSFLNDDAISFDNEDDDDDDDGSNDPQDEDADLSIVCSDISSEEEDDMAPTPTRSKFERRNIIRSTSNPSNSSTSNENRHNEAINVKKLGMEGAIFHSTKETIKYKDRNHCQVLFQLRGSVWPSVMPYCIVNVIWTFCIWLLDNKYDFINLSIPTSGHSFLSILVSFLVVTRVNIIYGRFNEARNHLSACFHYATDLMNYVSLLSDDYENEKAKQWRKEVAIKIVLLMRVMIAAIEYTSQDKNGIDPWDTIRDMEDCNEMKAKCARYYRDKRYSYRNIEDEARGVPIVYASSLRKELLRPRREKDIFNDDLNAEGKRENGEKLNQFHVVEEMKLLAYVTNFCASYHGLSKLISTPLPFPLVQKTQTILYFWIFTLPQTLIRDDTKPFQTMLVVFFITFGFFGLEFVSKELSDPFGNDPNDFNTMRFALRAYEDIYTTIFINDGAEYADEMHYRCSPNVLKQGQPPVSSLNVYQAKSAKWMQNNVRSSVPKKKVVHRATWLVNKSKQRDVYYNALTDNQEKSVTFAHPNGDFNV